VQAVPASALLHASWQVRSPQLQASTQEKAELEQPDCAEEMSLLQLELRQSRQVWSAEVGFSQLRPLDPHAGAKLNGTARLSRGMASAREMGANRMKKPFPRRNRVALLAAT